MMPKLLESRMNGARSRGRTGTLVLPKRRILSPLCLPISPPGQMFRGERRNRTGINGLAIQQTNRIKSIN